MENQIQKIVDNLLKQRESLSSVLYINSINSDGKQQILENIKSLDRALVDICKEISNQKA
jgi:hypothetical protein